MEKIIFPQDFVWGSATSSYQIEGAASEDGKGESIWDRFTHIPGMVRDGANGDTGCDHYHLYERDVALIKELGLKAYRLSVSWPRIFPDGTGKVNPQGLGFYKKLLKLLRENSVKTAVTLYHWDLPQKLQDRGGWANRQTCDDFEQYARRLFSELDGLVDWWVTLNEPFCTSFLGYWTGVHAPGIRDFSAALLASHNLLLAHGKAVRAFREMNVKGEIGITLNMNGYFPLNDCENDRKAAELSHAAWNKWFYEPLFKGRYPDEVLTRYRGRVTLPEISGPDLKIISAPTDFLGLNNYFSESCTFCEDAWPLGVKNGFIGEERTEMGWGVNPEGLYQILKRLNNDCGGIKLYITENGCASNDVVNISGEVEDPNRIDYLKRYLIAAHRAINEGVNLKGYFEWSLMDNFEWERGFSKRFGIVHVDYKTKKRTIKQSGYWYRDVIAQNGFQLSTV